MKQIIKEDNIKESFCELFVDHIIYEGIAEGARLSNVRSVGTCFSVAASGNIDNQYRTKIVFALNIFYAVEAEDEEYMSGIDCIGINNILAARLGVLIALTPLKRKNKDCYYLYAYDMHNTNTIYKINFKIPEVAVLSYIDNCLSSRVEIEDVILSEFLYLASGRYFLDYKPGNNITIEDAWMVDGSIYALLSIEDIKFTPENNGDIVPNKILFGPINKDMYDKLKIKKSKVLSKLKGSNEIAELLSRDDEDLLILAPSLDVSIHYTSKTGKMLTRGIGYGCLGPKSTVYIIQPDSYFTYLYLMEDIINAICAYLS